MGLWRSIQSAAPSTFSLNEGNPLIDISNVTTMTLAALKCAQAQGASFAVSGDEVICTLNNATAKGSTSTYAVAALRALAKQQSMTGS